jgi:CheY-like chemotaxis protein
MAEKPQSFKILVIDDEPIVREVLAAMLEVLGHTTLLAKDGLVGLELFQQEQPKVVFTDLVLPNMSGQEIIIKLRQLNQDIFIVVISGYAPEVLGSDANLQKPFTQEQLQAVIELAAQRFPQS